MRLMVAHGQELCPEQRGACEINRLGASSLSAAGEELFELFTYRLERYDLGEAFRLDSHAAGTREGGEHRIAGWNRHLKCPGPIFIFDHQAREARFDASNRQRHRLALICSGLGGCQRHVDDDIAAPQYTAENDDRIRAVRHPVEEPDVILGPS